MKDIRDGFPRSKFMALYTDGSEIEIYVDSWFLTSVNIEDVSYEAISALSPGWLGYVLNKYKEQQK